MADIHDRYFYIKKERLYYSLYVVSTLRTVPTDKIIGYKFTYVTARDRYSDLKRYIKRYMPNFYPIPTGHTENSLLKYLNDSLKGNENA